MRITQFSLLLATIILMSACKKEILIGDPVPTISIRKISPSVVKEFTQSIIIELAYEDGDGDLGFENPDSLSLWVKDSRIALADMYHIPPLAPIGESLYIKGTVEINLNSAFLMGNGGDEKVNFTVKLKDRQGNWSNEVTSKDITITK